MKEKVALRSRRLLPSCLPGRRRRALALLGVILLLLGAHPAPAEILFWPARLDSPAGDGPGSVAIGDLDGDQAPDLAVADYQSDDVAVLLGTGGGPVPVELAWFEVVASANAVTVVWQTSFEADHLGFHIDRAEAGSDRVERVNGELIRSAGESGDRYEFIDRTVMTGKTYAYHLGAVDISGGEHTFALAAITVSRAVPRRLVLHQNHPNPFKFNPSTSIEFGLPEAAHVTLRIHDVSGSMVRTLVDDRLARSFHSIEWDGRDDLGREVASGAYYYRLEAGARSMSRRMVLVR